jgi:hypothetical protein
MCVKAIVPLGAATARATEQGRTQRIGPAVRDSVSVVTLVNARACKLCNMMSYKLSKPLFTTSHQQSALRRQSGS